MTKGSIGTLNDIPFLNLSQAGGKFCSSLNFFKEGEWRIWLSLGDGRFVETYGWPAEGCYFGDAAQQETDVYLHFMDFIAQKASYEEVSKPFLGLHDDLCNLSASLAKISHIHKTKDVLGVGDSRMVVTEVEYFFSVCRSMIDLFQEIACKLWNKLTIYVDYLPEKKNLRNSFREMVWYKDRLTTKEELQSRFGLPEPWADFYLRHADFFLQIRKFRDNIVHNGSQVQTIFSGESGYLVNLNFKPFGDVKVWRESDKVKNDLVPLMPALGMIAFMTLLVCEDFSEMMQRTFEFPEPIVPGMRLFTRGFFDEHFVAVLGDARDRYVEFYQGGVESEGIKAAPSLQ
ncbi:hypothetical protein SAMN05216185_103453 [Pseudomonas guariconensis]|nr:hypothetical protein SAMN05216185_103453 [Pseudomonas guariconensis]